MNSQIESRKLGSAGPVFPLALGCMGMSGMYGQTDENDGIATIHAALDHGITLLDTGDFYGMGHNEMLGIAVTAYGVLSRGLLSGSAPAGPKDFRSHLPRFSGDNFARNQLFVEDLKEIALQKGVTPSQLAIAWVLAQGSHIVPVIGARKRSQLFESLGALEVTLSGANLALMEKALPASAVAGTRYDQHQMKMLDSERGTGS